MRGRGTLKARWPAVKQAVVGCALGRMGSWLLALGEGEPRGAQGLAQLWRVWPQGQRRPADLASGSPSSLPLPGPVVWLALGPAPSGPACAHDAHLLGLDAQDMLIVQAPDPELLASRLTAVLHAAARGPLGQVVVDARGAEWQVGRILGGHFWLQRWPAPGFGACRKIWVICEHRPATAVQTPKSPKLDALQGMA